MPKAPFRRQERANLPSRHRCLWPRPAFEATFRWPSVSRRRSAGRGNHVTHWHVHWCRSGLLRWLERWPAHAPLRAFYGVTVAVPAFRNTCFPSAGGKPAQGFLPDHRCNRNCGLGTASPARSWRGTQRQGTRLCPRRSGLRSNQRILAPAPHFARNFQCAFDTGGHSDTTIRAGGDDAVVSRLGRT